jgi:hypothetical protein
MDMIKNLLFAYKCIYMFQFDSWALLLNKILRMIA